MISYHNIPQYLDGLEEVKDLDLLLTKIIERKRIIPFPENKECLDWVKDMYKKTKDNPTKDNLLEYGRAMFPGDEQEASFRAYAEVLAIDKESPQAFHYIGKILMNYSLYAQAHLLFDNGLKLKSSSTLDQYRNNMNFHRKFHNDLADLIQLINDNTKGQERISNFGFPIDKLGFRFDEENGFYISDFAYNSENIDYEDYGWEIGKERTLMHIHGNLARESEINKKSHEPTNCPYLAIQ